VLVSWDIVAGVTGYSVQRSTDGVTYTTVGTPSVNSYLDSTVSQGTLYYYQVASSNGTLSPYSTPQSIVPASQGRLSLASIRLLSQQRADRVNSNFVTLPEWNTYINQSYFELYDLLVQKYGDDYFVSSYLFATNGSNTYPLPPDFYKGLGLDLSINASNNAWITLKRFNFISRNRYVYPQITTNVLGVAGLRYRFLDSNIVFEPNAQAGQTVRLWYVPRLTQLLQDTDVMDGVSGWTEYVVVDAAIKALQKEESDVSVLVLQKQALIDRIEAAAENRDAGEPNTISNTRRWTDPYGDGFGGQDGPSGGY
jgi:hypothetical protein